VIHDAHARAQRRVRARELRVRGEHSLEAHDLGAAVAALTASLKLDPSNEQTERELADARSR
jgi:hypothetical protein